MGERTCTTFVNAEGVTVRQSMQTAAGVQKGAMTTLAERGKFRNNYDHELKKMCCPCGKLRGEELMEYQASTPQCCGMRALGEDLDFAR